MTSRTRMRVLGTLVAALLLLTTTMLAACERKGPAQRAGEKIDDAVEDVRDAVDPPKGSGEKVGREIDRAVDED